MRAKSKEQRAKGLIFVISGPSGSGKSTLLTQLIKDPDLKHKLVKSVSFTTRPRRSAEKEGRDYFFIREDEFKQKLKAKKILEWTKYLGYYYATAKYFIEKKLKSSQHILLCLDIKGALRIRCLYPQKTVLIFVNPPSLKLLRRRIEKRCNKTKKEEILKRLKLARREILASQRYDYCLVNKDLSQAVRQLKGIILRQIAG